MGLSPSLKRRCGSPESRFFDYKILEELNVKPEQCLIVEDALIGVEAGNSANIEVAVIYDKYSDKQRKKINDLSQYQFADFEEMLNYIKDELGD